MVKSKLRQYLLPISVGVLILALALGIFTIWKLTYGSGLTGSRRSWSAGGEDGTESEEIWVQRTLTPEQIAADEYLATAKKILDYLWTDVRLEPEGLYALAMECDKYGGNCEKSMSTANHPLIFWARHQFVEATGDQTELERLQTDIDSFQSFFVGSLTDPGTTPYRTSAYGCGILMSMSQKSHYLDDQHRQILSNLCQRSMFSADVNSFYGNIFGLEGGVDESYLDQQLSTLLAPFTGDTTEDKIDNYQARINIASNLLPQAAAPESYADCDSRNVYPMVGGFCDAASSYRVDNQNIYDERYAYYPYNQAAKTAANLQPSFYDSMPAQPSFELEGKALALDGLLYYYSSTMTDDYALGKRCLLRQGLLSLIPQLSDSKLKQTLTQFVAPDNYFLFEQDTLYQNSGFLYITSQFECAQAAETETENIFMSQVETAWQGWRQYPEAIQYYLFIQPKVPGESQEIPTFTNSLIAGALAHAYAISQP